MSYLTTLFHYVELEVYYGWDSDGVDVEMGYVGRIPKPPAKRLEDYLTADTLLRNTMLVPIGDISPDVAE